MTNDDDPVTSAARLASWAGYRAAQAAKWAKLVAQSPTNLICGHCDAPMIYEAQDIAMFLRCSAKCKKAGRKNVRQWRTREGRVMNVRHMEDGHLQRAIDLLEREHRTNGMGYAWLREEAQRRNLPPLVKFAPPERADYDLACEACGRRIEKPPLDLMIPVCECGVARYRKVEPPQPEPEPQPRELTDEWDLDPPPKRGISLKGVPK